MVSFFLSCLFCDFTSNPNPGLASVQDQETGRWLLCWLFKLYCGALYHYRLQVPHSSPVNTTTSLHISFNSQYSSWSCCLTSVPCMVLHLSVWLNDPHQPSRALHSSEHLLLVLQSRCKQWGDCAFPVVGLKLYNYAPGATFHHGPAPVYGQAEDIFIEIRHQLLNWN